MSPLSQLTLGCYCLAVPLVETWIACHTNQGHLNILLIEPCWTWAFLLLSLLILVPIDHWQWMPTLYFNPHNGEPCHHPCLLLTSTPLHSMPGRFDFFAAYAPTEDASPTAELDELFKLQPIGFGKRTLLPLHWWRNHQLMYPQRF